MSRGQGLALSKGQREVQGAEVVERESPHSIPRAELVALDRVRAVPSPALEQKKKFRFSRSSTGAELRDPAAAGGAAGGAAGV